MTSALLVTSPRVRLLLIAAGLIALTVLLAVAFATDPLRATDSNFFVGWDRESQALVLARVQQARNGSEPSWGLSQQLPDLMAPYTTFDTGATSAGNSYGHYPSQLGLQADLFIFVSRLGLATVGSLTKFESLLFAICFVAFLAALWITISRLLAVVMLLVSVTSPWLVSAAHNLYWVPWTWLLPAIAACALVRARSRRSRVLAQIAVALTVALKAGCGYEFITTVILLAAGMPLLVALLHRLPWRAAALDAVKITALALLGFLVILTIHALLAGDGSLAAGIKVIAEDAIKRTYGAPAAGDDDVTRYSLGLSPLVVLARYLVGWQTDLLAYGVGTPVQVGTGIGGLFGLIVLALIAVLVTALRGDRRWRELLGTIGITAAPAVSWYILAKSHAFTAVAICYVLWYLIFVPALIWVVIRAVGFLSSVERRENVVRSTGVVTAARSRWTADRSATPRR